MEGKGDSENKKAIEQKTDVGIFKMTPREKMMSELAFKEGQNEVLTQSRMVSDARDAANEARQVEWHRVYHRNSDLHRYEIKDCREHRDHCYFVNNLQTIIFGLGVVALIAISVALFLS